jgi:capsid protein
VLSRAIPQIDIASFVLNTEQYTPVTWKLRGWSWVDPTKEVNAYKEAVRAGFTTVSAVIAQTAGGLDIEDVIAERERELAMFEAAGIEVDTTVEEPQEPVAPVASVAAPADPEEPDDNEDDEPPARVLRMRANA